MNPILKGKVQLLFELTSIGAFAGIIFQLIDEGFIDHSSIWVGAVLGFSFWFMEQYLLSGQRRSFLKMPLSIAVIVKALVYLIVIYVIQGMLGFIDGYIDEKQIEEFYDDMLSKDRLILVSYTFVLYLLMSLYIQVNLFLGKGVLLKFLIGKYQKPTREHRIFMFLDMKSSTTIAEKLGHEKYYGLLNDFFHDISKPVLHTQAEIYQYVGDEVVLTWKTNAGLSNLNCIRVYFKIKEGIAARSAYYEKKYGVLPAFKAGLHFGEVISAQIGDIKREIVYNGDVLNTAARIQEQCNKLDRELLISVDLLSELKINGSYKTEKMVEMTLRGKESVSELHSIEQF